jgi:hypothetical protein
MGVCAAGKHDCGGNCVNDDSLSTCGSACSPCPAPANGSAKCAAGVCGSVCNTGYHRCGAACVSNRDPQTCGAACTACPVPAGGEATCDGTSCGFRCPGGSVCNGGCIGSGQPCNGVCPKGQHACGNTCVSDNSIDHCGTSCTRCPAPPAGTPTCSAGQCAFTCSAGFNPCGSTCASNDSLDNCGGCGKVCAGSKIASPTCSQGKCGLKCKANKEDCSNDLDDDCNGAINDGCDVCDGTPGQWQGCRGTGCAVCAELVADYALYFSRHPKCARNTTCAGQFSTCNANCPAPTADDKASSACDGTSGGFEGCRGSGCAVCAEKLAGFPKYLQNHPACAKNDTCAGQFFTCNSKCPVPTDADR